MALSILFNPMPVRLFEADGDFAAGALAYFYLARTTTPLTVYMDAPLVSAHAWPVVADAYGLLPPIYIEKGTEYKVRIEDALGSVLYAADGISNPLDVTAEGGGEVGIVVTADEIFQTGDTMWNPAAGARAGWVRCNGRTISKGSGAGTESNNDDCHDLFVFFWNNFPNAICPVTPGGRGGNAQADWDVAKSIATLDMRGRSAVGLDDMANTAANLIQVATTINTTNASTAVTVASTGGIAAGMFVVAAGVTAGTRVASVNSETALTLSANATATATGVAARFSIFSDAQTPGAGGGENTHTLLLTEGAQKETFFDLSGGVAQDIPVPTWAKSCVLTAVVFLTGVTTSLALRVSGDGTTFPSGGSDYNESSAEHNSGSAGYVTNASTLAGQFNLSGAIDTGTIPTHVTAEISLSRPAPGTSYAFGVKTYSKAYYSAAANRSRTRWGHGLIYSPMTSQTLKALRLFFLSDAAFGADSYVHVQWFGAAEPMAASSGLLAAPGGVVTDVESATLSDGAPESRIEPREVEPRAVGQSMAMNLHTPARLGTWFAKK